MPLGSSSDAPVMRPGPSFDSRPRTERPACLWEFGGAVGLSFPIAIGVAIAHPPYAVRHKWLTCAAKPRLVLRFLHFLHLLRQLFHGLNRHSLDVDHFSAEPSPDRDSHDSNHG